MTTIAIGMETEGRNNWAYEVSVRQGAKEYTYRVTLSWSDYEHWSHGRVAPERVVRAAFEFLLAREPAAEILSRFDCSTIRRYFPEIDTELPTLL